MGVSVNFNAILSSNVHAIDIQSFIERYTPQQNTNMANLPEETVKTLLTNAALNIQKQQDITSQQSQFNIFDISNSRQEASNITQQPSGAPPPSYLKYAKQSGNIKPLQTRNHNKNIDAIHNTTSQLTLQKPNAKPKTVKEELAEIVALLKQSVRAIPNQNPQIFSLNSLEFSSFVGTSKFMHTMVSKLESSTIEEFSAIKQKFDENANKLLLFSKKDGYKTDAISSAINLADRLLLMKERGLIAKTEVIR